MASPALAHLEDLLRTKRLDATLFRAGDAALARPAAATGVGPLDAALGGGWPRGEVSGLAGAPSSGRTSTMLQSLAASTARGEIAAVVDALDRFDPLAASAAGVDLARVLWARGPSCSMEMARPAIIERALHQAIRAVDLVIRSGGFGLVVLDIADVPALFVRALPATTWLRLARANEGQTAAVVVLSGSPVARSARGVTVRLEASGEWTGESPQSRRLGGLQVKASIAQAYAPPLRCPPSRVLIMTRFGATSLAS